jgi:hypothetical protein
MRMLVAGLCVAGTAWLSADPAVDLAAAMDVPGSSLVSASYTVLANAEAAKARATWGVSVPLSGTNLAVLSSGKAAAPSHPGYAVPSPGTAFGTSGSNPAAGQVTCGVWRPGGCRHDL